MKMEFLLKQYDFELEQRNSLTSATGFPVVAITVISGAICALAVGYSYTSHANLFVVLLFVSSAAILFSVYFLFRSFWNHVYKKIPSPARIYEHQARLVAWWDENRGQAGMKSSAELANADLDRYLEEKLIEAADWNERINILRGNFLHLSVAAAAVSLFFLVLPGVLYAIEKAEDKKDYAEVKIVCTNKEEAYMSNKIQPPTVDQGKRPDPTPPSPSKPQTPKPEGPPNVDFKGTTLTPMPKAIDS